MKKKEQIIRLAYVRWTEKRNMQAFQELILKRKISVGYLTTHVVKLENAHDVYGIMISKSEPFIGVLIKYDKSKKFEKNKIKIGESRIKYLSGSDRKRHRKRRLKLVKDRE